jgi:hypothetical protein
MAHADTTATWLGETGNWTDPTQWSTNPDYPNNGTPAGSDYDAQINAGTPDASATVTLGSDVTVNSLTLNNSFLEFDQTGGVLTTNSLNFTAGNYFLSPGASISTSSIQLGQDAYLRFPGFPSSDNYALNNVQVSGEGYLYVGFATGLTVGSSATLEGALNVGSIETTFTNDGTILANEPNPSGFFTASFNITNQTFTNNNLMQATNGALLAISANDWTNSSGATITVNGAAAIFGPAPLSFGFGTYQWTNDGTVKVMNSSTLTLAGSYSYSDIGNLTVDSSSTLIIAGTFNNTSSTLAFPGAGQVVLSGNITGGTFDNSAGNVTEVGNCTLNNVTITGGDLHCLGALTVSGTLNIPGHNLYLNSDPFSLFGSSDFALDGSATINADNVFFGTTQGLFPEFGVQFSLTSETEYDSFIINGNVELAGDLNILLENGFLPSSSDVFTLINVNSANTLTGSFLNIRDGGTLETADGSGFFAVFYNDPQYPNEVVLTDFTPVPEPLTLGVLTVVFAGSIVRRRRTLFIRDSVNP